MSKELHIPRFSSKDLVAVAESQEYAFETMDDLSRRAEASLITNLHAIASARLDNTNVVFGNVGASMGFSVVENQERRL